MNLYEAIQQFVPDGFRDEDGVWHEGPHRQAATRELRALDGIREAAWKVVIANQPVLLGTPEDALYHLLCIFDHEFGVDSIAARESAKESA